MPAERGKRSVISLTKPMVRPRPRGPAAVVFYRCPCCACRRNPMMEVRLRSPLAACLGAVLLAGVPPAVGDVVVQNNSTWNGECSLVVDPQNPAHLVVAWMKLGFGRISIAVSVSTDRGANWGAPAQLPHQNSLWTSADPTLAFGPDASVYLAYVDFDARHGT